MERLKPTFYVESNEKTLEDMYQKYLSCPIAIKYLHKIGLTDELVRKNIVKIIDFVNDCEYCIKCPGLAACQKEQKYICSDVTYRNGIVSQTIIPCKAYIRKISLMKRFLTFDFDDSWFDYDLKNLSKISSRNKLLKAYADIINNKEHRWLYILGGTGSGKSFLAAQIGIDFLKRNPSFTACFISANKRFKELVDFYYDKKDRSLFDNTLQKYINVDVLIIDDFGNEYKNDLIRETILFTLISKRRKSSKLTIFTSDFSIDDIVTMYSTSKSAEPKARQIGQIIKEESLGEINVGTLPVY